MGGSGNFREQEVAYEFIDLTLQPKAQTLMANSGGIAINKVIDQVTDQASRELNQGFADIVANDGLAFYLSGLAGPWLHRCAWRSAAEAHCRRRHAGRDER